MLRNIASSVDRVYVFFFGMSNRCQPQDSETAYCSSGWVGSSCAWRHEFLEDMKDMEGIWRYILEGLLIWRYMEDYTCFINKGYEGHAHEFVCFESEQV